VKKREYLQECWSLFEGLEELVEQVRPELENPGCKSMMTICCVQTEDGGFTRFVCGGEYSPDLVKSLLESLPLILRKHRQYSKMRAAGASWPTANGSKPIH
jgi:hypothetical protein